MSIIEQKLVVFIQYATEVLRKVSNPAERREKLLRLWEKYLEDEVCLGDLLDDMVSYRYVKKKRRKHRFIMLMGVFGIPVLAILGVVCVEKTPETLSRVSMYLVFLANLFLQTLMFMRIEYVRINQGVISEGERYTVLLVGVLSSVYILTIALRWMTGEFWHCILSFGVLFVVYLTAVVLAHLVNKGIKKVEVDKWYIQTSESRVREDIATKIIEIAGTTDKVAINEYLKNKLKKLEVTNEQGVDEVIEMLLTFVKEKKEGVSV